MDASSLTHSEGLGKMIQPAEEKPEEARKQCDLHHRTQEVHQLSLKLQGIMRLKEENQVESR